MYKVKIQQFLLIEWGRKTIRLNSNLTLLFNHVSGQILSHGSQNDNTISGVIAVDTTYTRLPTMERLLELPGLLLLLCTEKARAVDLVLIK